jgi:hypothetical protein
LEKSHFIYEGKREGYWGMDFDGAHSSTGSGMGIVLRSPGKKTSIFSYRIEFNYKKNIEEYESLILGIHLGINMNIKNMKLARDSDLIVS